MEKLVRLLSVTDKGYFCVSGKSCVEIKLQLVTKLTTKDSVETVHVRVEADNPYQADILRKDIRDIITELTFDELLLLFSVDTIFSEDRKDIMFGRKTNMNAQYSRYGRRISDFRNCMIIA